MIWFLYIVVVKHLKNLKAALLKLLFVIKLELVLLVLIKKKLKILLLLMNQFGQSAQVLMLQKK